MIWVTQSNTLKLELKNYADLARIVLSPPLPVKINPIG